MEDDSNLEDKLQSQLASLSLSHSEEQELLQCYHHQHQPTISSSPNNSYSSDGIPFQQQGLTTTHNLRRHEAAAASVHEGQLITLEENVHMRFPGTTLNLRRILEEMRALREENVKLRGEVQILQGTLVRTEDKLKQSENRCYALGVHLAMAMSQNG